MPLSYEDTILALGPVAYWRLDETLGPVMYDSSGNGNDGIYYDECTFGIASPIETDPASLAAGGAVGERVAPDDSSLDVYNSSSIGGWLQWKESYLAGTATLLSRDGHWGLPGGSFELGSITYNLIDNRWYFLVGTRSGNVMRLYANGELIAERTDLDGGGQYTNQLLGFNGSHPAYWLHTKVGPDKKWTVGIDNSVWHGTVDEPFVFDYALNATQVRTIYEAALNRLLSSVTIQVRVQLILDTDAPEPVDFAFAHNWTEPIGGSERVITEHLSWRTHGNRSEPDYEQRVNARPYGPRRALEYAITPTSPLARARLQRALWQPAQVFKLPILTDWVPLTAPASVSDVTLDCDTTLRDFEVGSYCTAFTDPYNPATFQFFRIASRTDSQLGISPAVGTAMATGLVAPARLTCLPNEESQLEAYVIDRETGVLAFEILDTERSTRRITAYVPTTTYQPNGAKPAIEVFSLDSARFDTLETTPYAIRQRQLDTGNLTGNDYFRGIDTATSSTIPVRLLIVSRETMSEFYGWLDARQGRQNPVWVPSRENDLTLITQLSGTVLRIEAGYAFYNLHYGRRDVQVTFTSGTVANRRITAVVDNGNGTEDITVASLPAGTISKISWLRFCVAPDSFELRFHRDIATPGGMVVECAWEFTELLTTP